MDLVKQFQESLPFGIATGVLSIAAAYIVNNFKIPTITFAASDVNIREQISQGISPGLGDAVLKYFQGLVPNNFMGWLSVVVSAVLLVFIGYLIYKQVGLFGLKDSNGTRAVMILLYASVAATLFSMMLLAIPFSVAAIANGIYFILLGIMGYLVAEYTPLSIPK